MDHTTATSDQITLNNNIIDNNINWTLHPVTDRNVTTNTFLYTQPEQLASNSGLLNKVDKLSLVFTGKVCLNYDHVDHVREPLVKKGITFDQLNNDRYKDITKYGKYVQLD